ncbi:MAG TPA: 16S rRNA (guanine(966)-N(2))-methyltransferase RsmD [Candidatus Eisenbacteria bacterium]|nr:16S rRNA (guanine(966)-N(2))-methyltransferase RsmD [Candidatus Eisenbacteria bacterium]
MPRIITGQAGGIQLETNEHPQMRPTTDRLKEAVFSSLHGKRVYGGLNSFLDLFAGCGQIGLEAKSRNVKKVVLVEQNRQAIQTIRKNIKLTKLDVKLLAMNAEQALRQLSNNKEQFDIIYFDPPWSELNTLWAKFDQYIFNLLNDDGQVMIEHSRRIEPEFDKNLWTVLKHRNYGMNSLLVLTVKEDQLA